VTDRPPEPVRHGVGVSTLGADVIRVDIAEVRAAIDNLVTDARPALAPGSTSSATPPTIEQALPGANAVTVDLFDGSGNTALGAQARDLLQGKGFRIGGDTWLTTRSSTVLRYAPGDETGLALVKQALEATIKSRVGQRCSKRTCPRAARQRFPRRAGRFRQPKSGSDELAGAGEPHLGAARLTHNP
jgi:hypothetical protein